MWTRRSRVLMRYIGVRDFDGKEAAVRVARRRSSRSGAIPTGMPWAFADCPGAKPDAWRLSPVRVVGHFRILGRDISTPYLSGRIPGRYFSASPLAPDSGMATQRLDANKGRTPDDGHFR